MQRSSMLVFILWIAIPPVLGAERKFPYQAVVDVAEEYVRSGPGKNYYPTSKLRRGDRVTVIRDEPGGWRVIVPPAGSFNWIHSDYVKRQGNKGVLTENNVIARIGSEFNDELDLYRIELSKGDTVEILGEKTFETERGPVKMLKIKPPANEYRFIMGRAIVPAETPVQKPLQRGEVAERPAVKLQSPLETGGDPFQDGPSLTKQDSDQPKRPKKEAQPVSESIRQTGPDETELEEMRTRLLAVDRQFHEMIQNDPSTWNLVGLEQQYRQLDELYDTPAFQTSLKQRLDAVERYTKIKTEYEEFVRVTTETRQRDAQLMSLRNQPAGATPSSPALTTPGQAVPAPASPPSFDGAGIVRRAASAIRGAPQFVLVAPDGRRLAYLQGAPGVDLNAYVGQAMGIVGQRSYRQELQAELIVVRSLTPVRLKGP